MRIPRLTLRRALSSKQQLPVRKYKLLFPGQGSQYVGMASKLPSSPAIEHIFSTASRVLDYDLRALCFSGPQHTLEDTVHCQPAVVVASLGALEHLRATQPEVIDRCTAVAGMSVGEFTALMFSQALSLEAGLKLVHLRAVSMQHACIERSSKMTSVIGLEERVLQGICDEAETRGLGVACISNHLFPKGYVVSATVEALKFTQQRAATSGAVDIKNLHVSGGFHSSLMSSAVPKLEAALEEVDFSMPSIPVYSNVTGLPYKSVSEIKQLLAKQVTHPVLWQNTMSNMIANSGPEGFVEVGPRRQLRLILKWIDKNAFRACENIEA